MLYDHYTVFEKVKVPKVYLNTLSKLFALISIAKLATYLRVNQLISFNTEYPQEKELL